MHLAIVGATGVVGQTILKALPDYNLDIEELTLVASSRSVGKAIEYNGTTYHCVSCEEAIYRKPDIAIFSAGGSTSLEWAPRFAEVGCRVIDNSSAWRMDDTKKLVVPEVNAHVLEASDYIIANPNCSTIQLVVALQVLEKYYGLERVVVSTYQSVSGTGKAALDQLRLERDGEELSSDQRVYPYQIDNNCIPHCDIFLENDYTKEEMKLLNESRKILQLPQLKLTATAVRVPVSLSHSESVNVELKKPFEISDVKNHLEQKEGITVLDDPAQLQYPMPFYAAGSNDVFVGRLRRDTSHDQALNMWVVSDNLRKGAATNALQIAEIVQNKFLNVIERTGILA